MSDALDIVKTGLKYAGPVVHALQVIQAITGLGGSDAATALKAADAVVKTTLDGIAKGLDPDEIIKDQNLVLSMASTTDAKHDQALADKFKDKTP